jgi:hypothetical protein
MAVLPQTLTRCPHLSAAALLPLLALAGCVAPGPHGGELPPPSALAPSQIVVTWLPRAVQGVDTLHAGKVAVGLAGRVWLLGPDGGTPLVGDGALTVELYVDPGTPGAAPQLLENWNLDHDSLHKKCLKRDMIGWGYNLELPWNTYRPEIMHVLMRVCYKPANGSPLYSALQPVTLCDANQTVVYPPTTVSGAAAAAQAQAPPAPAPPRPAPAQAAAAPSRPQPAGPGAMSNLPTLRLGTTLGAAQGATP